MTWRGSYVHRQLGRCPTCMRQSFIAALISSLTAAAAWLWLGRPLMAALISVTATGLVLLWLAHVVAYARRAQADGPTQRDADHDLPDPSRRALAPGFAKLVVGVALATALPPALAHANCIQFPVCCTKDGDCVCSGRCSGAKTATCPQGICLSPH